MWTLIVNGSCSPETKRAKLKYTSSPVVFQQTKTKPARRQSEKKNGDESEKNQEERRRIKRKNNENESASEYCRQHVPGKHENTLIYKFETEKFSI